MTNPGYLYIRRHSSYDQYDACKLGITMCIPARDSTYSTGEIKRGFFALVVEIPFEQMTQIEEMLKKYFTRKSR